MSTDLLLSNARIVDGTGAPWFHGAVTVRDGSIECIVRGEIDVDVAETIDVDGQ